MRARDRNTYDHRLRELVYRTQDTSTVAHLAIPRSTLDDWLRHAPRPVVTLDELDRGLAELVRVSSAVYLLLGIITLLSRP